MGEDPLLMRFKGLQHLFLGEEEIALKILKKIRHVTLEGSTCKDSQIDDLIAKNIDAEGIKLLYDKEGNERNDIEKQIQRLENKVEKFPKFRDGFFHLAGAWLGLNRTKEAYEALLKYHQIDSNNPVVEYYLAALALDRMLLKEGKFHLQKAQELLKEQSYSPDVLKTLYLSYKKEDPTFDF